MKSVAYSSVFLWAVTSMLLSGCSSESNQPHSLKQQHRQAPTDTGLKIDYIDNEVSLLNFDLSEEFTLTPIKTYSL